MLRNLDLTSVYQQECSFMFVTNLLSNVYTKVKPQLNYN